MTLTQTQTCPECQGKGLINLGDYIPIKKKLGLQKYCDFCRGWGKITKNIVAIIAPKKLNNKKFIFEKLDYLLQNLFPNIVIVSGCSDVSENLIIDYAVERNLQFKAFASEYEKYRKKARYFKNKNIAQFADKAILFNRNDKHVNEFKQLAIKKKLDIKEISLFGVKYDPNSSLKLN